MRLPIQLCWRAEDGTLSFRDQVDGSVAVAGIGGSVEVDGILVHAIPGTGPAQAAAGAPWDAAARSERVLTSHPGSEHPGIFSACLHLPGTDLTWEWTVHQRADAVELSARLCNHGSVERRIGAWNVLHWRAGADRHFSVGAAPDGLTVFGWRPWDMRVERLGASPEHGSHNLCHIHNAATSRTLLCGFVTLDRMHGEHSLSCQPGPTPAVGEYRARCRFGMYPLAPGAELRSETVRLTVHTDPYEALEDWAETLRAAYQPSWREGPPVGWCGGGWIDAFSPAEDCWEQIALDNARAIRDRLRGFGVNYVWTSQTNLVGGVPGNWLESEATQIPSGLESFCAQLQRLGFTPGLWVSPFWFYAEAAGTLARNQANLLRDGDGQPIVEAESWEFDRQADPEDSPRLHRYYLDGTHPETAAFVREVFARYRAWGVRYYMLDFLGLKEHARLHDPSQTPVQAARRLLPVIRDAAGSDTHLQTAVSSTPAFIGLIDAARVGRDFGEGRPLFPPYATWRNGVYVLHDQHFGSTYHLVQNAAASYFTHRKAYLNDFNLLTVDKPVPVAHAQIAVTVFGLGGGSPLMLGDDYRHMDEERLRLVKLCLPRLGSMPRPVDLFTRLHPDDRRRLLVLPVQTAWDSYTLVAAFNLEPEPWAVDLDFAGLGLDGSGRYQLWEFWTEEYCGIYAGHCRASIPPASVRLFRLAPARPHPWLLSTDLHLQQGAAEVRHLHWDESAQRLSGSLSRPVGETGSLFVLMPRRYRLLNHGGIGLMKEVIDMNVVARVPVRFAEGQQSFALSFAPVGTRFVSRRGWLPYATEAEWLAYVARTRAHDDPRVIE